MKSLYVFLMLFGVVYLIKSIIVDLINSDSTNIYNYGISLAISLAVFFLIKLRGGKYSI